MVMEDVAVNFTAEEWAVLGPAQKGPHTGVMRETFRGPASVGEGVGLGLPFLREQVFLARLHCSKLWNTGSEDAGE